MLQSTPIPRAAVAALSIAAGLFAPAFAGTLTAQEGAEDPLAQRAAVIDQAIDAPLVVGGEPIPTDAIRRSLAYSVGKAIVESRKMDLFIAAEIDRQVKAGADPASFLVGDSTVDEQVETTMERLNEEFPDSDPQELLKKQLIDTTTLRGMVEQTQLFDRVFLPDNPHEYPATTMQALQSQAGQEFVDKLIEGYDVRIEQGIEVDENDSGRLMWKNIMRQFVMKALNDNSDIEGASDGIPADAVLMVNGRKILTSEVFDELVQRGRINVHDIERTRLWLAKMAAVEAALRDSGHYIGDEEFESVWEAEEAPYKDSPFNLEVIAVGFRKFPSVDDYRHYFRLLKSYERMIADEVNDENLKAHLDARANEMLGLGKVRAEIILLSAYVPQSLVLREGGWDDARERAVAAATELAEGKDWDEVLEKHSDFVDAIVPESQRGTAPPSMNKGRFPLLHRNELVQRLGESDYWHFLSGSSVVDHVFHDQEIGSVDGPFEGIMGYYITRVMQRTKSSKKLSIDDPNQRELVVQDYLAVRFNEYAQKVLANTEVTGLAQH